ncbi:MAG: hypothetical protein ACRC5G_01385 [Cetobacterium sp.]
MIFNLLFVFVTTALVATIVRLDERVKILKSQLEFRDEKISELEKEISVSEKFSKEKNSLIKRLESENFKLKTGRAK